MEIMQASGRVTLESPVAGGVAINVSAADQTLTTFSRALWVGTAGNVKVDMLDGTALTINNVQDGTLLPIRVSKVYMTGTTASNMVALW